MPPFPLSFWFKPGYMPPFYPFHCWASSHRKALRCLNVLKVLKVDNLATSSASRVNFPFHCWAGRAVPAPCRSDFVLLVPKECVPFRQFWSVLTVLVIPGSSGQFRTPTQDKGNLQKVLKPALLVTFSQKRHLSVPKHNIPSRAETR